MCHLFPAGILADSRVNPGVCNILEAMVEGLTECSRPHHGIKTKKKPAFDICFHKTGVGRSQDARSGGGNEW